MLSIILPTYNEAQNLPELLRQIGAALGRKGYEVIVVDDNSPDRTWEVAERLKVQYPLLRVIRRMGVRGLSSAVVQGFDASMGSILIVMDADLQHDPAQIPALHNMLHTGADIVVTSRFSGEIPEDKAWSGRRRMMTRAATFMARLVLRQEVSDPLSGFFAIKKSVYDQVRAHLRPRGFKILFEILSCLPASSQVTDIPVVFRKRSFGSSKLNLRIIVQFHIQLFRAFLQRFQVQLFSLAVILIVVVLLPKALRLHLLYTDPVVRQNVESTLQRVAGERGWLLSELSVRRVYSDHVMVNYRMHRKGTDSVVCRILPYNDTVILPCD